MKVRIDAGGRTVEIECPDANTTVDAVGATALQIWRETTGSGSSNAGPAFGLQTIERNTPPDSYRRTDKGVPIPVRAEVNHA